MKRIVACDLWAEKDKHYEFNKNLIIILQKNFKNKLEYFGEYRQIMNLKKN